MVCQAAGAEGGAVLRLMIVIGILAVFQEAHHLIRFLLGE